MRETIHNANRNKINDISSYSSQCGLLTFSNKSQIHSSKTGPTFTILYRRSSRRTTFRLSISLFLLHIKLDQLWNTATEWKWAPPISLLACIAPHSSWSLGIKLERFCAKKGMRKKVPPFIFFFLSSSSSSIHYETVLSSENDRTWFLSPVP